MIMFAIQEQRTKEFLPHHRSRVMPALYQTKGVAKRVITEQHWLKTSGDWQVVRVKLQVVD